VESGQAAEAGHSLRALEIFRRLGAADRESAVLNNMGAFAYWAGRWDEAVELYRRGADASTRAGDVNYTAFADCNVGEVLSDQGRAEEAEPLLRRALKVWKGTADEHGVAYATALLGRLHVRAGRVEEGIELLESAQAGFQALNVGSDAALVQFLLCEAALFAGRGEDARERARALFGELAEDARLEPMLHYLVGVALAQTGDIPAAGEALATALETARAAELRFETALALDALEGLSRFGARPSLRRRRELQAILEQLDIVRLPAPPLARPRPAAAPVSA
jgi:tetratricopeptide (TPR) repeat protein